jgi:hypothetical protein
METKFFLIFLNFEKKNLDEKKIKLRFPIPFELTIIQTKSISSTDDLYKHESAHVSS